MRTRVLRLREDAFLPQFSYPGDAGMDLHVVGDHRLSPGESRDLPTGISIELPPGYWGRITGRSGTVRRGLFVNEGVIDNGYRGELLIYVTNRNATPFQAMHGERLGQLIVQEVVQTELEFVAELSPSARGTNGFGSTGTGAQPVDRRGWPTGPTVYLGGAVDFGADNHSWRHLAGLSLSAQAGYVAYCPICECKGLDSDEAIIERNFRALDMAEQALLYLGGYSVGTPIEAWRRVHDRRAPAVLVAATEQRGVFVRYLASLPGARLAGSIDEAVGFLVEDRTGATPSRTDGRVAEPAPAPATGD